MGSQVYFPFSPLSRARVWVPGSNTGWHLIPQILDPGPSRPIWLNLILGTLSSLKGDCFSPQGISFWSCQRLGGSASQDDCKWTRGPGGWDLTWRNCGPGSCGRGLWSGIPRRQLFHPNPFTCQGWDWLIFSPTPSGVRVYLVFNFTHGKCWLLEASCFSSL